MALKFQITKINTSDWIELKHVYSTVPKLTLYYTFSPPHISHVNIATSIPSFMLVCQINAKINHVKFLNWFWDYNNLNGLM